jgi:two-component system, NtrC family, response regulator HydG
MKKELLILDDDTSVLESLVALLEELDYAPIKCNDPHAAIDIVRKQLPEVVITDLKMPGLDGLEVLQRIKSINPDIQVILITGYGSVEDAVSAMRYGAYDFISKPFNMPVIEAVVRRAFEKTSLLTENFKLKKSLQKARIPAFTEGKSPAFRELLESSSLAANSDATILILGESGTGKEVLAHYITAYSKRADKPLVTVNCAAIPENLIESELFGHKKGSFTSAYQNKNGRFQEAHTGTIFLDEVGELPLALQAKLLRVLQEGEVTPVGGPPEKVDVRIIAATNRNLRKMVSAGRFREDLFYRLNVIPLFLPPLRERMEDLPMYISYFIAKYCRKNRKEPLALSPEALHILECYSWPGNIRELENAIERAVILTTGPEITAKVLPPEIRSGDDAAPAVQFRPGMKLDDIELIVIQKVLERNRGDRAKSAEELGIGVRTIYRKLNEIEARKRGDSGEFPSEEEYDEDTPNYPSPS